MTTKSSSVTIQREIDRVGGECVAAGDDARLWKLGDGRLVIEANGEPAWEGDSGFSVAAMTVLAEAGADGEMHYESDEWQALRDHVSWNGWWPVIEGDGVIYGTITDGRDRGYLNVNDEAMIGADDARAAGWRVDTEEGTAVPSDPVTVEFAAADETIRDRGGIDEFAGLEHPAMPEACAAYRRAAIIAMADDDRASRLDVEAPKNSRSLHSQWCGAHWGYSAGAIGTMARDLTDAERAAIDAAHEAGLAAARTVIEERDAASLESWSATHRITTDSGEVIDVMLDDGVAYTAAEWCATVAADYECDEAGRWLFQGQPFAGSVEPIHEDA
jgi:hypothetical protein